MNKRQAGRKGGLTTSARHDAKKQTEAARLVANGLERYIAQVLEADGSVSWEEARRRAVILRRLHMQDLAYTRWGKGKGA